MRTAFREEPRRFDPDGTGRFVISDMGTVELGTAEQITFVSLAGSEYDVARCSWGYYATPSLNRRLPSKGLRPVLTCNDRDSYYLCLVEVGQEPEFTEYLDKAGMRVVAWLDDTKTLSHIKAALP